MRGNKLQTESAEFANATSGKAENLSLVREMSGLSSTLVLQFLIIIIIH